MTSVDELAIATGLGFLETVGGNMERTRTASREARSHLANQHLNSSQPVHGRYGMRLHFVDLSSVDSAPQLVQAGGFPAHPVQVLIFTQT